MGLVHQWFQSSLDVVFFVYGLAFVIMGVAVWVHPRKESEFQLARILWLFVAYALIHAPGDFLDMWAIAKGQSETLYRFGQVLTYLSYPFLFEFGRRLIGLAGRAVAWWILVVISIGIATAAVLAGDPWATAHVLAGYFIRLPGGVMAGLGFFWYYRSQKKTLKPLGVQRYFYVAGIALLAWSVFCGLVREKADFFPASWLNTETFSQAVQVPVYLFRSVCALVVAWAVPGILDIFTWETLSKVKEARSGLERQSAELVKANEQLEREITERVRAEEALHTAYDGLEVRVEERTAELARANQELQIGIAERVRAEQALQRRLEELVVLHAAATIGAQAISEDALIADIASIMDGVLDADRFSILLLDKEERKDKEDERWVIPLGHGIAGQVAVDGQPRRVSDLTYESEPLATKAVLDDRPTNARPMRSELSVPLVDDRRVIGVIDAASAQPGAFSEADERLLATLASQLVTAIEKVRLLQTLEQRVADRTRDLQTLYQVTAIAGESLDLESALEHSLERSLEAVQCQAGAIQLLDEAGATLQPIARCVLSLSDGCPPVEIASLLAQDAALSSWVVEQGKPLVVPDIARMEHKVVDLTIPQDIRSGFSLPYIGMPMRVGGKVAGVLTVVGQTGQQFNAEEVALLASIADHMAVAVENARLRQQAERTAVLEERERLARELHDSLTQSLYSLTLFAEAGREFARGGEWERARQHLAWVGEIAQQALKEMRLLVYELSPPVLEQEGLVGALQQRLDAVEGRAGVQVRLLAAKVPRLPVAIEKGLYRIAQEALNNALKHAAATSVTVYVRSDGEGADQQVSLEVVDDGAGFDPGAVHDKGGAGLINMRQRAEGLGGVLVIRSTPGEGTRVKVAIGVQRQPRAVKEVSR